MKMILKSKIYKIDCMVIRYTNKQEIIRFYDKIIDFINNIFILCK